VTEDPCYHH